MIYIQISASRHKSNKYRNHLRQITHTAIYYQYKSTADILIHFYRLVNVCVQLPSTVFYLANTFQVWNSGSRLQLKMHPRLQRRTRDGREARTLPPKWKLRSSESVAASPGWHPPKMGWSRAVVSYCWYKKHKLFPPPVRTAPNVSTPARSMRAPRAL